MGPKMAKPATRAPKRPSISILDLMTDENLLGSFFTGPSWSVWRVFFAAMFALPMTKAEREVYRQFTQREYRNDVAAQVNYAVLVCGRRSGKSRILALVAIYLAIFCSCAEYLAVGEVGTILILAASKDQAKVIFRYIVGMLNAAPMLAKFIKRQTADTVVLSNGLEIRVSAASFRTTRGVTTLAIMMDECAFWWSDEFAAESDVEILRALKPSTMTIPGSRIMIASSPYRRAGLLWNEHRRLFGNQIEGELAWQATTRDMNETVPQSEIDAELAKDYEAAKSEYLACFRSDLEAFLSREALDPVILHGVREIAPAPGTVYCGGFDGAGGAGGGDSITAAVACYDRAAGYPILVACRAIKPPFSPEAAVSEFAAFFKSYRISRITGDRWGSGFVKEAFARHGITLEPAEKTTSDFFLELLPAINSGLCRMVQNDRLISELLSLERRTSRTGKDNVGHPQGANFHDDLATSASIALVSAKAKRPMVITPEMLRQAAMPSGSALSPSLGRGCRLGGEVIR